MGSYYALGASLPELLIDDTKSDYSTARFVSELKEQASRSDRALIDLVLLRGDNRALLALLREEPIPSQHLPLALGEETLRTLIAAVRSEAGDDPFDKIKMPGEVPEYLRHFTRRYMEGAYEGGAFVEDRLAALYHEHAHRRANSFLRQWFDLNINISNILAHATAKKFNLEPTQYLIGTNEIVTLLTEGDWSELTTMKEGEMIAEIVKIGEESDPLMRERKIDAFKWRILEEVTFADSFSINAMLSYLLKLQIVERWLVLDKEQGKARFREIIMGLKKEGREVLDTFVVRTKK